MARFHLRPSSTTGQVEVATLTIRWAAVVGDVALHTVTVPVVVTVGDGSGPDTGADAAVTEEVLRLQVARTRKEARDAAERGDYNTASAMMTAGADLAECLPDELRMVRELRLDAEALMTQTWTATDAKRNFSRSRSASKGRRTDYVAEPVAEPEGDDTVS